MNARDPRLHAGSVAPAGEQAERLHVLFAGSERSHGTYRPGDAAPRPGEKLEIKSTAKTIKRPATPSMWRRHLAGEYPLGVIPIREDGTCVWGVIDIDVYHGLSHADQVADIARLGLPLVVCKSKSGGAHLYLFLAEPAQAADVQAALRGMAARLGYPSGTEVFPKQKELAPEEQGNWLNMPYFGGDETTRHGFRQNGVGGMTVGEFLDAAEAAKVPPSRLAGYAAGAAAPARARQRPAASDTSLTLARARVLLRDACARLADSPPHNADLWLNGILLDAGKWSRDTGLERDEVMGVVLSAWTRRGKSYEDFLAQWPGAFEDGLASADAPRDDSGKRYPVVKRMVRIVGGSEGDEFEIYLAGYERPVTLAAKLLLRYEFFNTACVHQLGTAFDTIRKTDDWIALFRPTLEAAETRELPRDETVEGDLFEAAQSFCMDRHRGECREEVFLGKPFHEEENDRIWFRFEDLYKRLKESHSATFGAMSKTAVGKLMKKVFREGTDYCAKTTMNIQGRSVDLRWIRASVFTSVPKIPTRSFPGEPL